MPTAEHVTADKTKTNAHDNLTKHSGKTRAKLGQNSGKNRVKIGQKYISALRYPPPLCSVSIRPETCIATPRADGVPPSVGVNPCVSCRPATAQPGQVRSRRGRGGPRPHCQRHVFRGSDCFLLKFKHGGLGRLPLLSQRLVFFLGGGEEACMLGVRKQAEAFVPCYGKTIR